MPKVSVIVPVYNVEKYLAKCLESLVNQTLKDIEIIVVNDGSPDHSQDIIDKYVKKYPQKIKAFKKKNGGLSDARNYGLKYASGDYISFIDSDDWVEPNMLLEMYNKAIKNDFDIVVCNMEFFYEDNDNNVEFKAALFNQINKRSLMISSSNACNKLFKRELFKHNIQFLKGRLYEDLATSPLLFLYADKVGYIAKPFYHYLQRKGSIMNSKNISPKLDDIFFVMKYLNDEFTKRGFKEEYSPELEYLYIEHLLLSASLRYLDYDKKLVYDKIKENIIKIIKKKYPKWRRNKYYGERNLKYKMVCNLIYYQQFWVIKMAKRIGVL